MPSYLNNTPKYFTLLLNILSVCIVTNCFNSLRLISISSRSRNIEISNRSSGKNVLFAVNKVANSKHKSKKTSKITDEELSNHIKSKYGNVKRNKNEKFISRRHHGEVYNDDSTSVIVKEHILHIRKLNTKPCLVLNADYRPLSYVPLSIWSWQDTIKAVFSDRVAVVDVYPNLVLRSVNIEIPLPSVIALKEYHHPPKSTSKLTCSRRNVFLRDNFTCQYCGERYLSPDLSLDHVVPRSKGGLTRWDNLVTCCLKCNSKKGSLLVSEIEGMKLIRTPREPLPHELLRETFSISAKAKERMHDSWIPYLQ